MRSDYTHITAVIDESGSMSGQVRNVVGGFQTFIDDQKSVPGSASLTVVKFNTTYKVVSQGRDLNEIHSASSFLAYAPGGGTALLDAVGKAILETGAFLSSKTEDERPSQVVVIVMTDGEENSSHEFSLAKVREMVEHQEKVYGWRFLYIGQALDAFAAEAHNAYGAMLGIATSASTTRGSSAAYTGMSKSVRACRIDRKRAFSQKDLNDALGNDDSDSSGSGSSSGSKVH
jgi:uncharacterized protein YegL